MNARRTAGCAALVLVGLLAATLVVYAPALDGPYQFDDHVGVAVDPAARDAGAWWAGLGRHVRPLLKASYVATAGLGAPFAPNVDAPTGDADGAPPARAHRVGNLAIHLADVLLGHALALALLRRFAAPGAGTDRRAHGIALAAAAALALHPLATEAVSYVSGRSASLATGLSMLALLAWLRVRGSGTVPALSWFLAGTLFWLAAAGTREAALVTPFAWAVAEGLAGARTATPATVAGRPGRPDAWRTVAAIGVLGLLGIALVGAALVHPRYADLLALSARIVEARAAGPTFAAAMAHLGCVAVLACRPNVDPQPAPPGAAGVWLALAVLALAVAIAWRLRRRQPIAAFALAWMGLWLLPTYALPIRHDTVAERHAYPVLWSLGVLAAVATQALLARWTRWTRWPRWPARPAVLGAIVPGLLVAALLITLGMLAWQRNRDWRSEVALWEATRRDTARPTPRILNNLGLAYLEAGRWDDARRVLVEAGRLAPDQPDIAVNLERARRRSMH